MSDWHEDDTLAVDVVFNTDTVSVDGMYVQFKDDIDYDALPRGKADDDYFFVVVPTKSWNAVRSALHATLEAEQLRRFGIGRSFRIPLTDIIKQHHEEEPLVRFLLKMTIEVEEFDFVNVVRWTNRRGIDTKEYPFVIQTRACWNNYQNLLDEHDIRDTIRDKAGHPLAIPVKKNQVFRVKHDVFSKFKTDKQL